MAALSDYLENALLNHILRAVIYTSPSNLYLGLFNASPADDDSATEVSGFGYAREEVTFAAASGGSISNDAQIDFGAPSGGDWGTVSHFGLYDASSGGNLLIHGSLTTAKVTADGDPFFYEIGDFTITAD